MSKKLIITLKDIEELEALADQMKIKARGLRKKLLHFYAGVSPKGRTVSLEDEMKVIQGFRKSIEKKVSRELFLLLHVRHCI